MPHLIIEKTDKIWEIEQRVAKSAEAIIPQIDMDALLANPRAYSEKLGQDFLEAHLDEIEEGAQVGKKFAEDILIGTKKRNNETET